MADLYPKSPDNDPIIEDFFGAGKPGYSDGVAESLEEGTVIDAKFANGVTGELMPIMEQMGVTPVDGEYGQVWDAINNFASGDFSDGNEGDVVIGADTSISSDKEVVNATVSSGFALTTNGYKLFVTGTLTIEAGAVIRHNGADGADGADGGAGGAAAASGSLAGGSNGGDGPVDLDGDPGGLLLYAIGGDGGDGGDEANATRFGGAGGEAQDPSSTAGAWRNAEVARRGELRGLGNQNFIRGGAGGGGGAGKGLLSGGGGGGGAGIVIIWANEIVNNGVIQANGGAGGIGHGVCGGGGGGGGGAVYLVYRRMSGTGTVEAAGGAGGTSEEGGQAGTAGQDGQVILLRF